MGRSEDCTFDGLAWTKMQTGTLQDIILTDKWGRNSNIETNSCGVGCKQAKLNQQSHTELFWNIPCGEFDENLVRSYGASIRYNIDFDGQTPDKGYICAAIRGGKSTYFSTCSKIPESKTLAGFELHEHGFMQTNNKQVTRERFMMALAQCKSISVRAHFNADTTRVRISNVHYGKAIESRDESQAVSTVEQCTCPVGYEGK